MFIALYNAFRRSIRELLMHPKTGVAYLSKAAKSIRHKNKQLNKPENFML